MFIVYTKSHCPDCIKAKKLLQTEETILINCDDLLQNDRESFLIEMRKKTNLERITFPMVFLNDEFLGGINELTDHIVYELSEEF